MADLVEHRFPVMGTTAHLIVLDGQLDMLRAAATTLTDLEGRWSRFRQDSELAHVNRAAGRPVVVSPETYRLVATAVEAWHWSDGRFDPTVGASMTAAGYDRSFELLPPADGPASDDSSGTDPSTRHAAPTPAAIELDPYPGSVMVRPGAQLDLGGVAKGFAADLVAAQIMTAGAAGCCVNIGGDLRVMGEPPRPEGWLVALDCPGATDAADRTAGVVDGAICTSTTTRRRWRGPAGVEHHLRDPRSGAPLATGLVTATILAATGVQAEVLTKMALALGPGGGADAVRTVGASGLFVDDGGAVTELDGLDPFLHAGRAAREPAAA